MCIFLKEEEVEGGEGCLFCGVLEMERVACDIGRLWGRPLHELWRI